MAVPEDVTVLDIITYALQDCRAIQMNESPTAAEIQDGVKKFNFMLSAMSTDGLLILESQMDDFLLTAGKRTYTIGESASYDFNTVKPIKVTDAYITDQYNVITPVTVIPMDKMDAITDKLISPGIPYLLYYDPGDTQQTYPPKGTIELYPIPYRSTLRLFVGQNKVLTEVVDSAEVLTTPRYYFEMFEYNLAIRLWPQYHAGDPPMSILAAAKASRDMVEKTNIKPLIAQSGLVPDVGNYNIMADE